MVEGLFNYRDPRELTREYTQSYQIPENTYAQLPLLQQLAALGTQAGAGIGTGLGTLFGGKVPQQVEQEVLKSVFAGAAQATTDPVEHLKIAAQGLREKGMEGRAIQLDQEAAKMAASMAQEQQARAAATESQAKLEGEQNAYAMRFQALKTRQPDMPDEIARAIASDPVSFREALKDPSAEFKVEDVDGFRKVFKVTPQGYQEVQTLGKAPQKGTNVNVNASPVIKQGTDVVGLVSKFEDLTKPQRDMLRSAETAKTLINEASTSNNSQSWEAARTQLAKAVGESKLSNEDIRRTGGDPRLVQGALDWINKKVSGVPNQDIMRQLYVVASLLEKTSVERINKSTAQVRNLATAAGIEGDMSVLFPEVTSSGGGSSGGTADWSTWNQQR